ncbi:MAG TPA: phospholipid carrier-dependent glycosyltransferase [Actinomycetota bacterium]|nr:phospholipid carrier-dependent glycosyltransferase [Actinomycetota bacterium]
MKRDVWLIVLIFVATGLRMLWIWDPNQFVFDEAYYAREGCYYFEASPEECQMDRVPPEVHPPLGKWLIGAGVKLIGLQPFGWRIFPALAGGLTVGILFLIGTEIFRSTRAAVTAATVLALDPLHFVQARVAMLDIFIPFFGLLALWCALKDRGPEPDPPHGWWRPWRLGAGIAGGAALATKWPGLFILAFVVLFTLIQDLRRREGPRLRALPSLALYFVAVPIAVYLASYIGRVDGTVFALPWLDGSWFRAFWDQQVYMLTTLANLTQAHSYQSPAWSWPLIQRPVAYFFCVGSRCKPGVDSGVYQQIMAVGNPFVWWPGLLLVLAAVVAVIRTRGKDLAALIAGIGFLFTFVPWLPSYSPRATTYFFYFLPSVPFIALAIGRAVDRVSRPRLRLVATAATLAVVAGSFAFYFPMLTKRSLTDDAWRTRIAVFDNCDRPDPVVRRPKHGDEETVRKHHPQDGWCWI